MATNTKDRKIAGDKHFCCCLLVLGPLEVCAGVDRVLTRPTCRTEKRIETVGVRPLIGVWDYLSPDGTVPFIGVGDSPFDHRGIERYFQQVHEFFDLGLGVQGDGTHARCARGWCRVLKLILTFHPAIYGCVWWTHRLFSKMGGIVGELDGERDA